MIKDYVDEAEALRGAPLGVSAAPRCSSSDILSADVRRISPVGDGHGSVSERQPSAASDVSVEETATQALPSDASLRQHGNDGIHSNVNTSHQNKVTVTITDSNFEQNGRKKEAASDVTTVGEGGRPTTASDVSKRQDGGDGITSDGNIELSRKKATVIDDVTGSKAKASDVIVDQSGLQDWNGAAVKSLTTARTGNGEVLLRPEGGDELLRQRATCDAGNDEMFCIVNNNSLSSTSTSTSTSLTSSSDCCFLDARTFQAPRSLSGPCVHRSLVNFQGSFPDQAVDDLLQMLQQSQQASERDAILQVLLVQRLPSLTASGSLQDIGKLLSVAHGNLRHSATAALLAVLLRKSSLAVEALSGTVGRLWELIMQQTSDDPALYGLACLFLLAASALLSHPTRPTKEQCSPLQLIIDKGKKSDDNRSSVKGIVIKAIRDFCEHYKHVLKRGLSEWCYTECGSQPNKNRRDAWYKASFCELIVIAYTMLAELQKHGWEPASRLLLTGEGGGERGPLAELCEAVSRAGKASKLSEEAVFLFHVFSIRALAHLINTVFRQDKPQFGKQVHDHVEHVQSLIVRLTEVSDKTKKSVLLQEVRCLAFHSVKEVKQTFNLLLRTNEYWLWDITLGHLQQCLQSVGFHHSTHHAQNKMLAPKDECFWNTVNAQLGGQPVEGTIYVQRPTCLANTPLLRCLDDHPGDRKTGDLCSLRRADSLRHRKNFDNLRQLSPHCSHLLKLLAFQFQPVTFYVTEAVEGHRLLMHLLECRQAKNWLPISMILSAFVEHILPALLFLQSRDMVCRDVTAYNMVVHGGGPRVQGPQERDTVFSGSYVIKLADLGLTDKYCEHGHIRPLRDPGQIPIRWTCTEALSTGEFTPASMVFSALCVLFEMLTHGLQPFTSYDLTCTEEIDTKRFLTPDSFKLHHWPCIPDPVNDVIQKGTNADPAKRTKLEELRNLLVAIKEPFPDGSTEVNLDKALGWDNRYSQPCFDQLQRNHIPNMCIPEPVRQLMVAGKSSNLYVNTRKSNWFTNNHMVVKMAELSAPDWVHISHEKDCAHVYELLSSSFVNNVLPSLEAAQIIGVSRLAQDKQIQASLVTENGNYIHKRQYPRGLTLKMAAMRGYLSELETANGSLNLDYSSGTYNRLEEGVEEQPPAACPVYIRIFLLLALTVQGLHCKGLLLRSLRAAHILLLEDMVVLLRLGRISRQSAADHGKDGMFLDQTRWSAPEVLLGNNYSEKSDVFMLVTVMWETLWIMEQSPKDPAANDGHFAPFADILLPQVVHVVRENTPLPFPEHCPEWLYYDLILKGRHDNPAFRPNLQDIINALGCHVHGGGNFAFMDKALHDVDSLAAPKPCLIPTKVAGESSNQKARRITNIHYPGIKSSSSHPVEGSPCPVQAEETLLKSPVSATYSPGLQCQTSGSLICPNNVYNELPLNQSLQSNQRAQRPLPKTPPGNEDGDKPRRPQPDSVTAYRNLLDDKKETRPERKSKEKEDSLATCTETKSGSIMEASSTSQESKPVMRRKGTRIPQRPHSVPSSPLSRKMSFSQKNYCTKSVTADRPSAIDKRPHIFSNKSRIRPDLLEPRTVSNISQASYCYWSPEVNEGSYKEACSLQSQPITLRQAGRLEIPNSLFSNSMYMALDSNENDNSKEKSKKKKSSNKTPVAPAAEQRHPESENLAPEIVSLDTTRDYDHYCMPNVVNDLPSQAADPEGSTMFQTADTGKILSQRVIHGKHSSLPDFKSEAPPLPSRTLSCLEDQDVDHYDKSDYLTPISCSTDLVHNNQAGLRAGKATTDLTPDPEADTGQQETGRTEQCASDAEAEGGQDTWGGVETYLGHISGTDLQNLSLAVHHSCEDVETQMPIITAAVAQNIQETTLCSNILDHAIHETDDTQTACQLASLAPVSPAEDDTSRCIPAILAEPSPGEAEDNKQSSCTGQVFLDDVNTADRPIGDLLSATPQTGGERHEEESVLAVTAESTGNRRSTTSQASSLQPTRRRAKNSRLPIRKITVGPKSRMYTHHRLEIGQIEHS